MLRKLGLGLAGLLLFGAGAYLAVLHGVGGARLAHPQRAVLERRELARRSALREEAVGRENEVVAHQLMGPAELRAAHAGDGAGCARRAHRPAPRAGEARAASRLGDRPCVPGVAAARDRRTLSDRSAALRALVANEFVHEEALYPEAEYAFKHALTQEVAYGSQLADRRGRLHAALARAIETSQSEKLDENASLLAHHWEEAGETLEASRWHARAAARGGYTDYVGTARHWQRVCELLGAEPTEAEAVALALRARTGLLALSGRLGVSDEQFEQQVREVRELARAGGDEESLARVLLASAYSAMFRADPRQKPLADEALRMCAQVADAGMKAAAAAVCGLIEFRVGSLSDAERLFEEAERHAGGMRA